MHFYGFADKPGVGATASSVPGNQRLDFEIYVCDRSTSVIECFVKAPSAIRLLTDGDIGAALALQQLEGWNQTVRDWSRLLQLAPTGCFAAELDGRLSGTVTTITYGGALAWIGMMLVAPEHRRRGIGTKLLSTALDYLQTAGIAAVKLDATPVGQPLYEGLGFCLKD